MKSKATEAAPSVIIAPAPADHQAAKKPEYYAAVRPLTEDEYSLLKQDIAIRGIVTPIIKDQDGNIIDGFHRQKIAEELNLETIPYKTVEGTEAELQAMAIALNVARRQLSAEDRRELVAKLRSEGKSVREIAHTLGASKSTVERDIQAVPNGTPETVVENDAVAEDLKAVPNGTPETVIENDAAAAPAVEANATPERITGKDGKSYPAKRNGSVRPTRTAAELDAAREEREREKAKLKKIVEDYRVKQAIHLIEAMTPEQEAEFDAWYTERRLASSKPRVLPAEPSSDADGGLMALCVDALWSPELIREAALWVQRGCGEQEPSAFAKVGGWVGFISSARQVGPAQRKTFVDSVLRPETKDTKEAA